MAAIKWRDALRSRPLAPGTRPRRSVALHITRKHARKTRACSAIRGYISRSLLFAKITSANRQASPEGAAVVQMREVRCSGPAFSCR